MIAGTLPGSGLVRADRLPKVPAFSLFSESPILFLRLVQDGRFVRSRQASFDVSSCTTLVIYIYTCKYRQVGKQVSNVLCMCEPCKYYSVSK